MNRMIMQRYAGANCEENVGVGLIFNVQHLNSSAVCAAMLEDKIDAAPPHE